MKQNTVTIALTKDVDVYTCIDTMRVALRTAGIYNTWKKISAKLILLAAVNWSFDSAYQILKEHKIGVDIAIF